ncbi:globin [Dictyocaulus viviparus]|uniref:Globin n=1 Tax=Dictyocaulus viviparus TaxID=29172 RepID=A0A0D8X7G0_DICVI|nr:globin [Dictyocaulus viviparus]
MGNSESSKALPKINRARSQSPVGNSDNSVRGTRKREVCRVTGLTLHQKALLMRKWNRMEAYTVYLLGRRMFVNIFTENPNYLAYIELKGVANWKNHINFKIHVQRFVTALSEAMHRLREPSNSYDVLRDFGASYANYPKRVAPVYFERLANALSQTAAQLQESDHQITEKATSRDDISCSTDGDKLKLLAETVSESISDEAEMNVSLSSSLFSIPKHHSSRISLSQMNCMKDDLHSECRGSFMR